MGKTTKVYLRESENYREVSIKNESMPEISNEIMEKWQRIINIMAKILKVPAGLIMQITKESMVVFLKSQNEDNPYPVGGSDTLGHGLYCETVIGNNDELLVENALNSKAWENNPDVKLNMISYYGLPIHWPSKEFFGTICVLDSKENKYSENYKQLLSEFREAIEADLKNLIYEDKLKFYADIDVLTSSYNRNKIEKILKKQFEKSREAGSVFSVAMLDINKLKKVNDENGHIVGDKIIKTFANAFKSIKSDNCSFGRWGGDEFLLICPNHGIVEIEKKMNKVYPDVINEMQSLINYANYCYGCAEFKISDESYEKVITRADDELYKWKKILKSK
ncbi:MAG: sensor domain-containing diguanylate cyclase [Pleomorphochaeta sp.]